MVEKLKGIPGRILEWWNKFDARRKLVMISTVLVVVIAMVILGVVLMQPKMETLVVCDTAKDASEIKSLLETEGIETQVSDDGLTIKVKKGDLSSANIAMGANGYPAAEYDLETVFDGGFSSTEADKKKKYTAYLEQKIASDLATMDVIENARVTLDIPLEDGTIISKEQDTYVSVTLALNGEIDDEVANSIAKFVATAVGNKDTSSVTILDSKANLLFSGETLDETGVSSTQIANTKEKYESQMKKKVRNMVLDTKQFDAVTVAPNLVISTSNKTIVDKEYFAPDGREEGMLDYERGYTTESNSGTAGTPGTDSNDDTPEYQMQTDGTTSSETNEYEKQYLPNSTETTTLQGAGAIDYDESTISVVATKYVLYDEATLEKQGELDDMTFEEFMAAHDEEVSAEGTDDMYELVAMATNLDREKIKILSFEIPVFQPKEEATLPTTTILTIVLIVLILGLLGFIVFKGTRSVVVEEVEPEVSVEDLLASTRNEELEDIEYDNRSEVRKLIEKFVDENPAAVAQLLRNWLNDDWE